MSDKSKFWETKPLSQMTPVEWESLCDGCGKCCMAKIIDDDTDELYYTTVACQLFDAKSCQCSNYENRQKIVSDCVRLSLDNVGEIAWLPQTCAYRLLNEGKPLFDWHPLISGDKNSVHAADISMRDKVTIFEQDISDQQEYIAHIIDGKM